MTTEELFRTIQSRAGGGSGRGISYWSNAAKCGRKAILDEQAKQASGPQIPVEAGSEEDTVDALAVGTTYHALHEMSVAGALSDLVWDLTDGSLTESFLEGTRLYRAYTRDWGSVGARFGGTVVGAETPIPSTEVGEAEVAQLFGDKVTGRIDLVLDIVDPEVCRQNTGLIVRPGRYLLDFKSLKSHSAQHQWSYQFSMQAATYLHIYNMENPETPALGMIFDIITKTKTIRKEDEAKGRSSYAAFLQRPEPDDVDVVKALVHIGKRNVGGNVANPSECLSGFAPCKWFVSGKCPRY